MRPDGYRPAMLAEATVEIWLADLDSVFAPGEAEALLDDGERDRAAAASRGRHPHGWAASRALLRSILGEYASIDPAAVRFELGPFGKPALATGHGIRDSGARIQFNVSHSGSIALCAFALDVSVGIDVELADRRRPSDGVAIARRLLGHDVAERLGPLPERQRHDAFLREWTAHEARIKCLGLSLGLAVDRHPDIRARLAALSLVEIGELPRGAFAALAFDAPSLRVRRRQWAPQAAARCSSSHSSTRPIASIDSPSR